MDRWSMGHRARSLAALLALGPAVAGAISLHLGGNGSAQRRSHGYNLFHLGRPITAKSLDAACGVMKEVDKKEDDLDNKYVWFAGVIAGYLHDQDLPKASGELRLDYFTGFNLLEGCHMLRREKAAQDGSQKNRVVKKYRNPDGNPYVCVLKETEPGVVGFNPCALAGLIKGPMDISSRKMSWYELCSDHLMQNHIAFFTEAVGCNMAAKVASLSYCNGGKISWEDFDCQLSKEKNGKLKLYDVNLMDAADKKGKYKDDTWQALLNLWKESDKRLKERYAPAQ